MICRRIYNWIRRFRHRCGYGVHSPSDFHLITCVVYEKLPYYKYKELAVLRPSVNHYPHHREKVDRLLLRLANYLQLPSLTEIGTGSGLSSLYLWAGNMKMDCVSVADKMFDECADLLHQNSKIVLRTGDEQSLLADCLKQRGRADLVHIGETSHYEQAFSTLLPYIHDKSCVLVSKPYADEAKRAWWKKVVAHPKVTVSFDLFDLGILFFDSRRSKEHRIVNFF